MTGSVGIGTSKLMAKIASDLDKPDGLVVVAPGTRARRAAPAAGHPARRGRPGDRRAAAPDRCADGGRPGRAVAARPGRPWSAGRTAPGCTRWRRPRTTGRWSPTARRSPCRRRRRSSATSPTSPCWPRDRRDGRPGGRPVARRRPDRPHRDAQAAPLRLHHPHPLADAAASPTDDPRQIAARRPAAARRGRHVSGGLRLLGVGVSGLSVYAQGDLFADQDDPADDAGCRRPRRPRSVPSRSGARPAGGRGRTCGTPSWARAGCGERAGPGHRAVRGAADPAGAGAHPARPTTRRSNPPTRRTGGRGRQGPCPNPARGPA